MTLQRGSLPRYLLLAASGLISLAVFYVLDVWLLGTLAAIISGQLVFTRTHSFFRLPASILQHLLRQDRLPGTGVILTGCHGLGDQASRRFERPDGADGLGWTESAPDDSR